MAGQHPTLIQHTLGKAVVGIHLDLPGGELRHTTRAITFFAGKGRIEPCGAGRQQDLLTLPIGDVAGFAIENDGDLSGHGVVRDLWLRLFDMRTGIGGGNETLDVNLARIDMQLAQSLFHGRHEWTGSAEIEIRVHVVTHMVRDASAIQKTVHIVKGVNDLDAAWVCARELIELVVEDDRTLVAIGIDEFQRVEANLPEKTRYVV